ncbi:integrase core domain-containing protein [Desulfocurvibacter africanus]|uniref:integrase core domain-containing protein n=1 Tax=Desulfocurvibacter africanus TaxID=873 RepID=UPI00187C0F71|nr:integrase core domain-containing protein [Desulfocurvibacter africanus]
MLHILARSSTLATARTRLQWPDQLQGYFVLLDRKVVRYHIADWFEDYNERRPHKGLRMISSREFIRSIATAECPF